MMKALFKIYPEVDSGVFCFDECCGLVHKRIQCSTLLCSDLKRFKAPSPSQEGFTGGLNIVCSFSDMDVFNSCSTSRCLYDQLKMNVVFRIMYLQTKVSSAPGVSNRGGAPRQIQAAIIS